MCVCARPHACVCARTHARARGRARVGTRQRARSCARRRDHTCDVVQLCVCARTCARSRVCGAPAGTPPQQCQQPVCPASQLMPRRRALGNAARARQRCAIARAHQRMCCACEPNHRRHTSTSMAPPNADAEGVLAGLTNDHRVCAHVTGVAARRRVCVRAAARYGVWCAALKWSYRGAMPSARGGAAHAPGAW